MSNKEKTFEQIVSTFGPIPELGQLDPLDVDQRYNLRLTNYDPSEETIRFEGRLKPYNNSHEMYYPVEFVQGQGPDVIIDYAVSSGILLRRQLNLQEHSARIEYTLGSNLRVGYLVDGHNGRRNAYSVYATLEYPHEILQNAPLAGFDFTHNGSTKINVSLLTAEQIGIMQQMPDMDSGATRSNVFLDHSASFTIDPKTLHTSMIYRIAEEPGYKILDDVALAERPFAPDDLLGAPTEFMLSSAGDNILLTRITLSTNEVWKLVFPRNVDGKELYATATGDDWARFKDKCLVSLEMTDPGTTLKLPSTQQ